MEPVGAVRCADGGTVRRGCRSRGAFRTMTGAAGYARLLFDRLFPKRKNAGSRQKSQEKPVKSCANSR